MLHDRNAIIQELHALRASFDASYPSRAGVELLVQRTLSVLFPHFPGHETSSREDLSRLVETVAFELCALARPVLDSYERAEEVSSQFVTALPSIHRDLREDAHSIYTGDPAARSVNEVILAYPGFMAISVYRIANWLFRAGVPIVPRMMTEFAHERTGIDIHPGATIARGLAIDHGTGIVIGETTVIEENVKLYQGVTLGGLSVDKSFAGSKRHPTIERDVVIYANATILGGDTTIGARSVIGGNVWITTSVPAGSRVYHRADITVKPPVSDE